MSTRCMTYMPSKPGTDPVSMGPVTTFIDGEGVTDYHIFEDKSDVLVFRHVKRGDEIKGTKCAKFMAHGLVLLPDADELFKFYNGKHPRKEK